MLEERQRSRGAWGWRGTEPICGQSWRQGDVPVFHPACGHVIRGFPDSFYTIMHGMYMCVHLYGYIMYDVSTLGMKLF